MNRINRAQLPNMLRLLDDASPEVRSALHAAFGNWGGTLRKDLEDVGQTRQFLSDPALVGILEKDDRVCFRNSWLTYSAIHSYADNLEYSLERLSALLDGRIPGNQIGIQLDDIAANFARAGNRRDAHLLARYLFTEMGLKGAGPDRYYRPENCNLRWVIQNREGIPISLATVYILVGSRLDLQIRGFNFPGHFLALAQLDGQIGIVDCFNGGRIIRADDLEEFGEALPENASDLQKLESPEHLILMRYLRNLINAYHACGDIDNEAFFLDFLKDYSRGRPV